MNDLQLSEINSQISYPDGKIYWAENKGYTSKLIQNLSGFGYYIGVSGAIHTLYNDKGQKITSAFSHVSLLKNAAIVMR